MRRIILVLVILGVLGAIGAGAGWYVYRNRGPKLLARAELNVRAGQFEKALEQARRYIAENPDRWQGYYVQAEGQLGLGDYAGARSTLEKAAALNPRAGMVWVALADTHSAPARRALASPEEALRVEQIVSAIEQLQLANGVLDRCQGLDEKEMLDVVEARGLNVSSIAYAERAIGERREKEALIAEAARDTAQRDRKRKESEELRARAEASFEQATATLLEVVRKDASRRAADTLVNICLTREDVKSLDEVSGIVMAMADPPAAASTRVVMWKLRKGALTRAAIEKAREFLDARLKQHPKEVEVQVARAQLALMLATLPSPDMSDLETAQRICDDILAADARQGHARLILGNLLMLQGEISRAEQELLRLKTDFPTWPDAQFTYARAALAAGYPELAREALRAVTRLDPKHAMSHRYLAEMLMREGFYDQAFTDAQAYYDAHQDQAEAVRLFVDAARQAGRPEMAREALVRAAADHGTSPEMLAVVAAGYASLGETERSRETAALAVAAEARTGEDRVAVARSLLMLDRESEAEKALTDELAANPDQPRVHFELGRLYDATGRTLQAIDHFREAVRGDTRNSAYRVALAQALFRIGDIDECRKILDEIEAANAAARLLRLQIDLLLGQPVSAEQIELASKGEQGGLPVAMAYLATGRPQECVDLCLKELKKTPDDADLRWLLGQAHLSLGQREECLDQWQSLLKSSPRNLSTYIRVAAVLSRDAAPDAVEAQLAGMPGARADMVALAMGWLFSQSGNFDAAAESYGRVGAVREASEEDRGRARLLRAQALARAGHADRALTELDLVAAKKLWYKPALLAKSRLLAGTGRTAEAETVLATLRKDAAGERDAALLVGVAEVYSLMKKPDAALSVCDELEKLYPKDVRPHLSRASILQAAGRGAEMVACFRKAVELQPGNFAIRLALARSLDAQQQPLEAIDAIKQLSESGPAGRPVALLEQGAMFARWGLQSQAVECFEELRGLGYGSDPRIRLSLGRAFAALGQKDRAREELKEIPKYAAQYVLAQQLLAELAEDTDAKLEILGKLDAAAAGRPVVVGQTIAILMDGDRHAEAAKAFAAFAETVGKGERLPGELANLAVRAMLLAGDVRSAGDLCERVARESGDPGWRRRAILLMLDGRIEAVGAMLPEAARAEFPDALLGFCAALRKGSPAQEWTARLSQLDTEIVEPGRPRPLPPRYKVLVALAAGDRNRAKAALARFEAEGGTSARIAAAFVDAAEGRKESASDAARLMEISLAADHGLQPLARSWALELLKARPSCQWAATLAVAARPDGETHTKALELLEPKDCLYAQVIRAALLFEEKKYDQAAQVYRGLAEADPNNWELPFQEAIARERAGELERALELYRKVWERTRSTVAANNASYLITRLFPQDAARLAEAQAWSEAAVAALPEVAGLRDTKGWVAYLQKRYDAACLDLRQAVKGLPNTPEVHCHLGMAEAAAGRNELARWHLAAAVTLGESRVKKEGAVGGETPETIRLAREALAKLEPPQQ